MTLPRAGSIAALDGFGLAEPALVYDCAAASADPPQALRALERLLAAGGQAPSGDAAALRHRLDTSATLRENLTVVLGASAALGDHLVARAAAGYADWSVLTEPDRQCEVQALPTDDVDALRAAYRRRLLRIAAADLSGRLPVMRAASALSELADDTLAAALRFTGNTGAETAHELTVIALGKCGARELNYVSDVDVMFVLPNPEPIEPVAAAAQRLMCICREVAWQVDAGLRPEGHHGALVRTVDSYHTYYQRWAHNWEFQALLKARWATSTTARVAVDDELAVQWSQQIAPMVWQAAGRPGFVADARAMLQRVRAHAGRTSEHDVKLGPGGLRDIEFAVQLLQLVHGRTDYELRASGTVAALDALTEGGYVGRADGAALSASYCFLRQVEHRLQLRGLRRTHRAPTDPAALRWLARALGYHLNTPAAESTTEPAASTPARGRGGDPVELFLADWRRHGAQVRQLHEKLFYRPL
ncbi:MAG: bifunctional [glutamine synthetase] adenylyltransferase/[glutamine synthetase]-adenylyl-L-tyrosine phosphorylase, partial [Mycobacteriales bacterium]